MSWTIIALIGIAAATAIAVAVVRRFSNQTLILPEQLQRAQRQSEPILLLDVRTADEFNSGHIPGAVLMPHDVLLAAPREVSRNNEKTIVVYCETGSRARLARRSLLRSGFTNVFRLKGDMAAWRASGLPMEPP